VRGKGRGARFYGTGTAAGGGDQPPADRAAGDAP
jgi:hypothetical protein